MFCSRTNASVPASNLTGGELRPHPFTPYQKPVTLGCAAICAGFMALTGVAFVGALGHGPLGGKDDQGMAGLVAIGSALGATLSGMASIAAATCSLRSPDLPVREPGYTF